MHLGADDEDLHAPALTPTFVDSDAEDGELGGAAPKTAHALKPMRGWAYPLLWLPSFCDLTGTTVSIYIAFLRGLYRHICAYGIVQSVLLALLPLSSVHLATSRLCDYGIYGFIGARSHTQSAVLSQAVRTRF